MAEPGLLSLLPVVVAIGLALTTRKVLLSLFAGVLTAAAVAKGAHPWDTAVYVVNPLLKGSVWDLDHAKVTFFSLLIAATVALLGRGGATEALVEVMARVAGTRRRGLLATWAAGLVVFFDDYANCLIVGNAMRPLTDRLRISREKLAYLVDSTAAPVATLAIVSTWVGYEVGLMDQGLEAAGLDESAYAFFLEGIPWRFYPWLALVFGLAIAGSGRDFGPMRRAEERALRGGGPMADAGGDVPPPSRVWLAATSLVVLIGGTMVSLWVQGVGAVGADARLFEVIGGADGYNAMMHGALGAWGVAMAVGLGMRAYGIADALRTSVLGMMALGEALAVLYLAWALGAGIQSLGAADALVALVGPALPLWALPGSVFIVSAAIAFATGTSFGTMAVLVPLVIPLAATMGADRSVLLAASAAVLSGATWGDHCSPISDTTVLSATGSGCDLAEHVTTQMPYALASGAIALLLGSLPAGFGINPWLLLAVGSAACVGVVLLAGRHPTAATDPASSHPSDTDPSSRPARS